MQPVPYPVTTPFGVPGNWAAGEHTGEDHACPEGTPVVAATGGTVRMAEWQGDYGYRVDVQADDNSRQHSYSHLSRIEVWPGQHLAAGARVGLSGNTGRSTGPHLHYEERTSPFGYWDYAKPIYPSQGAPEEDDMTPEQADSLAECRRMLAVLLAALPPGGAEQSIAQQTAGILENSGETRRQAGVLLAAIPPGPGEQTIHDQLFGPS